ncbi:hypothetical protein [Actinacidiphila reveromycinica]|uniref:hypothetical protein n=1 Tax=Actinacidiphila reveromycinica TaxID=659352 RepID=UPI001921210E|nr:hypothetical protein [Streptomyces sp. SN-593]
MRNDFYVADYGPHFRGWVGRTAEKMICIAPPDYMTDPTVLAVMREMVARQGGDCRACQGCPLGPLNLNN